MRNFLFEISFFCRGHEPKLDAYEAFCRTIYGNPITFIPIKKKIQIYIIFIHIKVFCMFLIF